MKCRSLEVDLEFNRFLELCEAEAPNFEHSSFISFQLICFQFNALPAR